MRGLVEQDEDVESEPAVEGFGQSLSLGFLAMAPLFLAYEAAVTSAPGGPRNTSELLLFRLFQVFGENADLMRRTTLAVLVLLALVRCLRRELGLVPRLARIVAEGAGLALLAGPILIGAIHLLELEAPQALAASPLSASPSPLVAGRVLGAGAYEELVFRVGAYSALFLLTRRVARFLGLARSVAGLVAEAHAAVGSAALFAAFHLATFVSWLGRGGDPFDAAVFTYRFLAGLLLAIVFRWRGPGVAAWTHGLFNLALLLGAGPDVFL